MAMERTTKELVLGTGQYAYIQDLTGGIIKVFTGPAVINQSAQDRPVIYDPKRGWVPVESLADAVRTSPIAVEGYYMVLFNPPQLTDAQKSIQEAQPKDGITGSRPPALDVGKRVNIPGPVTFALWPGQAARHVRGHHLRLNQYLRVQVYNEAEASKHWNSAVVQSTTGEATEIAKPKSLTVGTTLLVKGTDVSFYIPPTGIKVLERSSDDYIDGDANVDKYVRDALTLERLEYSILVDEKGNKRYEQGPQVVFPEPTERFISKKNDDGKPTRKFRALELTPIQGIHLKVIAPYKEGEREFKEGEELFVTGKDTAIYYPREEHSLISYDGQAKHFATAIPAGEARYVLNRLSGEIRMVKGPKMYLPDPRDEVFVRRVLSDEQCALWYPSNVEALAYNQSLREMLGRSPSTRAGVVSDGDFERANRKKGLHGGAGGATGGAGGASRGIEGMGVMASSTNYAAAGSFTMADASVLGNSGRALIADEFTRGSNYTDPRTLTLNTKYQGVPTINLWPGYAVTICRPTGTGKEVRRAVIGPATVHLEYDETLEVLELSTGRPKTTDKLYKTVYLRATATKVTDEITVETSDHVAVKVKVAYNINFTGDTAKWFNIENYVKYFTDHMRSILKGAVHQIPIAEFYEDYTNTIRTIIIGAKAEDKRPGFTFSENGMNIDDVDVFEVHILNVNVKALLDDQHSRAIKSKIDIANATSERAATEQLEVLRREIATLKLVSAQQSILNQREDMEARHQLEVDRLRTATEQHEKQKIAQVAIEAVHDFSHAADLRRRKETQEAELAHLTARQNLEMERLESQTEATKDVFAAVSPGFSEAILAVSHNDVAIKVSQALSAQAVIGGANLADTVTKVLGSLPLGNAVQAALAKVPTVTQSNNGQTPRA